MRRIDMSKVVMSRFTDEQMQRIAMSYAKYMSGKDEHSMYHDETAGREVDAILDEDDGQPTGRREVMIITKRQRCELERVREDIEAKTSPIDGAPSNTMIVEWLLDTIGILTGEYLEENKKEAKS